MMRIAWGTDLHWDAADERAKSKFLTSVYIQVPDCLLLTGDISDRGQTRVCLSQLAARVSCPIYFVLGNHDCFGAMIDTARRRTGGLTRVLPSLTYLSTESVIELSPQVALVGHDGWYDARLGDYLGSDVWLPDFREIEDLASVSFDRRQLQRRLEALGAEAARHLDSVLAPALDRYPTVLVATHVPPFGEAVLHDGEASDADWLPFFSCQAIGDVLVEAMHARSDRKMIVLCGHTHSPAQVEVLDNLRVLVGGAKTGEPRLANTLEFD